jgi:type I restriction enzyme, S subunit
MIADLEPYPAMKDSGVEWLGQVPETWEVRRNGRLFAQRNETGFAELPILEVSLRTGVRVRDFENSDRKQVMSDRDKYKRALAGDIAYNTMRMWQGAVGVAPADGLISPAYVIARPLPGTESRYFERLFRTPAYMQEVDNYSRGIVKDRNRLYWEDFKAMPTCYPPPGEQAAIVRYLDHVDRRVRRLVRTKRKLIALLTEQKQAIIHRAVTRGLDPDVPLKDSGVEWLGEVPEHWDVTRLKWVTRLQRGYDLPAARRIPGPFPVVSSGGVIGTHAEGRAAAPGVVMGRYGSTDAIFYIEQDYWPHNTSLFVTDFQGNSPKWCYYLLRSISKADHAGKSAVPGVDRKDLFQIVVCVPPAGEQPAIVGAIESGSRELDEAVATAKREIELLNEYRTRLIADVVTGKLDVREAAAALPEIDPLDAEDDLDEALESDTEADLEDLDAISEEDEV